MLGLALACLAIGGVRLRRRRSGDGRRARRSRASPRRCRRRSWRASGSSPASAAPRSRRRCATAIREGEVAGVVLFAENFPSRAAGRRLIARLQAIPRPPKLRDPLLVMVDQEGGLVKRLDGAPTASASEMGARGAAFSARQGRRTAANLRDVGVNVDLAPVLDVGRPGGVDRRNRTRLRRRPRRGSPRPRSPSPRRCRRGGVAATGKHFPGFGAAPRKHRLRGRTDRPLQARAAARSTRRPTRAFVAAGRRAGDAEHRDLPGLLRRPGRLHPRDRHRRAARPASASRASRSPTRWKRPRSNTSAAPPRPRSPAPAPATDLLLFAASGRPRRPGGRWSAKLRAGALDRAEFEQAAQRVLDLRAGLAP